MGENFQVTIPVENEAEAMESLETHLAAESNEETPETPEAPAEPVEEAEAEAETGKFKIVLHACRIP